MLALRKALPFKCLSTWHNTNITCPLCRRARRVIISIDVEKQLRSEALKLRLLDESLSHGSIELYLMCLNLITIGWGEFQPFNCCPSLLRVDLSGCPKLESISEHTFSSCHDLVSVIFGEHSNIANLEK